MFKVLGDNTIKTAEIQLFRGTRSQDNITPKYKLSNQLDGHWRSWKTSVSDLDTNLEAF